MNLGQKFPNCADWQTACNIYII